MKVLNSNELTKVLSSLFDEEGFECVSDRTLMEKVYKSGYTHYKKPTEPSYNEIPNKGAYSRNIPLIIKLNLDTNRFDAHYGHYRRNRKESCSSIRIYQKT